MLFRSWEPTAKRDETRTSLLRSRLTARVHAWLEGRFPEKRLFLRSDAETRFIRLTSETQLVAWTGGIIVVGWTIIATAILLMDSIGAGNFRAQAARDQMIYEERLNSLSIERDIRASEAVAAQRRFTSALDQISIMQTELLSTEDKRRELETGLEVVQATLRNTMKDRRSARSGRCTVRRWRRCRRDRPVPRGQRHS